MSDAAKRHLIFWSVALLGAALDLVSKDLVFGWLAAQPGHQVSVIDGFFTLRADHNPGTFFGLLAGHNSPLIIFTVLMMALVIIMFLAPPGELVGAGWGKLYTAALALVLAGAAGNLWDRVQFDGVRDFLALGLGGYHWPTFNLADTWLTLGIIAYLIATWRSARKSEEQENGGDPEPDRGKAAARDG
jgi:signal peptidase II